MLCGKEWIEDLYERLEFLSKTLEGSGRIDEQDYPDAYRTILDAIALCAEIIKSPNADEANEKKYNRLDKEFSEAWDRGDYDT